MLLVGSRATKFHLPDFREPRDWDLIATRGEIGRALAIPGVELMPSAHPGLIRLFVSGERVELEVADPGSSAFLLMEEGAHTMETPVGPSSVLSLDGLFLLKRSHIWHKLAWRKHFIDYKWLQATVHSVPSRLDHVLRLRLDETRARYGFRENNFDLDNEKFFGRASGVFRAMPHDRIHEIVKFNDRPVFERLKDDLSTAKISFERHEALPFVTKIQNMQEECMALTLERHLIPAHLAGVRTDPQAASRKILEGMCHNYLPFDFRFFAVDHFGTILDGLPPGFWEPVLAEVGVAHLVSQELSP